MDTVKSFKDLLYHNPSYVYILWRLGVRLKIICFTTTGWQQTLRVGGNNQQRSQFFIYLISLGFLDGEADLEMSEKSEQVLV